MAFNGYLYDRAARVRMFTTNAAGVPLLLPFELVTVDGDLTFYELLPPDGGVVGPDGNFPVRNYVGVTWLAQNGRLPRTGDRTQDIQVFEYHGI